jgi:putative transposase
MPMRKTSIAVGEYYHLYNRGVDKRDIFLNNYERNRFLLLLLLCNSKNRFDIREFLSENEGRAFGDLFSAEKGEPIVHIGAYCLMSNHFHLLAKEIVEGGISEFMHKLGTSYSSFFNGIHDRSGSLFQGRFKAEHAESDQYLKYLYSYIHLNPVKHIDPLWKENGVKDKEKVRAYLDGYVFSSFPDYKGDSRPQSKILHKESFPDYFATRADLQAHIEDFLSFEIRRPGLR